MWKRGTISGNAASRPLSRRQFVQGLGAGVAGAATVLGAGRRVMAACAPTAYQITGPFYPVAVEQQDWDMTRVAGGVGRAEGEVIEVVGRVLNERCEPVPYAVVEVWQANTHGRYDHPNDPNPAPLDPNFQGYARLVTDVDGRYRVLTVKPGAYPVNLPQFRDWTRPPHIHFKIHQTFAETVTTQMYFAGDPLNEADLLLQQVPEAPRSGLIVDFSTVREDGIPRGTFDIAMTGTDMPGATRS